MKKTSQNYKSRLDPVWCPGCGNFAVLRAVQRSFKDLGLAPENIIVVSGIGCSGRLSHYLNTYSLHGTHGRAVPTALGAKVVRPDLTVVAVGGDGDGLGIGGGHISHAARKNVDITYLLIDNRVYGLTKGQASPTTPLGYKTKTTPYGVSDLPMNPIPIFIAYEVSFVARTTSADIAGMSEIINAAITHPGMSIVTILSPCQTFPVLTFSDIKNIMKPLPEGHTLDDKMEALEKAYQVDPIYMGIFYRVKRPTLTQNLQEEIEQASRPDIVGKWDSVKELIKTYS